MKHHIILLKISKTIKEKGTPPPYITLPRPDAIAFAPGGSPRL